MLGKEFNRRLEGLYIYRKPVIMAVAMLSTAILLSFVMPPLKKNSVTAQTDKKPLRWYTLDEAMDYARRDNKKVMIFVVTDWCGYCRMMQKKAFTHPEVVEYMNEKVCPVKLNAWTKEDIWFQGYKFKFMPELHIHQLAYQLLEGRMEYPTAVFMTYRGEILGPVRGYMEHKPLLKVLRYYGDDIYLNQTWDEYKRTR
jgi:thioredoxin-related protein